MLTTARTLEIGTISSELQFSRQTRQVLSFRLSLQLRTHMYWLHSPNPELVLCLEVCSLSARDPGILICFAWNPDKLKPSLPDSMDCSLSAFMKSFGTLMLWLFLWTAKNLASLPLSMHWLEPNNFACFYEKLGTLILCLFLRTAQNPESLPVSMDWSEPSICTCFYEKLGTLILRLFLWTARKPSSLPVSMNWLETSIFAWFYENV